MSSNESANNTGAYTAYMAFQLLEEYPMNSVNVSTDIDDFDYKDAFPNGPSDIPATTLDCLLRFGQSDNAAERQVAVRHILKALQSLETPNGRQSEDVEQVFALVRDRFAYDSDPLIRAELVEQVPMLCMCCSQVPSLRHKIDTVLIPLLTNFLNDTNAQVRKTCQAAIVILVEQDLLSAEVLQNTVCPTLFSLTDNVPVQPGDDVRLESIGLLCKIVTCSNVSLDWSYNCFLANYTNYLQDVIFSIRKVCAGSLGDISRLFGRFITENLVVPHLLVLSQDGVWGVRKACAEVYSDVSLQCSMSVRRTQLAPMFTMLLADPSRWVSSQAFQILGPFIATFANSNRTGLLLKDGTLLYRELDENDENDNSIDDQLYSIASAILSTEDSTDRLPSGVNIPHFLKSEDVSKSEVISHLGTSAVKWTALNCDSTSICENPADQPTHDTKLKHDEIVLQSEKEDGYYVQIRLEINDDIVESCTSWQQETFSEDASSGDFSSFNYWRTCLFDLDMSTEYKTIQTTLHSSSSVVSVRKEHFLKDDNSELCSFMERHFEITPKNSNKSPSNRLIDIRKSISPAVNPKTIEFRQQSSINFDCSDPKPSFDDQDIIPQSLLDNFVSMVEPSRAQLIETDISRHCAHNFPAVAFTLGRKHWPQLKTAYVTLANDMQWRVRQALAFSIHEMAAIVGEEYTRNDLLPVFKGFLRDLDEVRVGVLRHLFDFFKLLNMETRKSLLDVLADFMQTDNTKNWRFRHEFARQCTMLCELYNISDVNDYIAAIGLTLATDRIADIRKEAANLLAKILGKFVESELADHMDTAKSFIDDIVKGFAISVRWLRRQTYANFCEKVLEKRLMRESLFAELLLQPLLVLVEDKIANVRLATARAIGVVPYEFWSFESESLLENAFQCLVNDMDRDCRFLASKALQDQRRPNVSDLIRWTSSPNEQLILDECVLDCNSTKVFISVEPLSSDEY